LWCKKSRTILLKKIMAFTEPTRYCLWCKDPLRGRSDKKFCDTSCRNAYHNQQDHNTAHLIKTINYVLRKNRNILAELFEMADEQTTFPAAVLLYKGFQFQYHTEVQNTNSPAPFYICYDFGYQAVNEELVHIVPVSKELLCSWHSGNGTGRRSGI